MKLRRPEVAMAEDGDGGGDRAHWERRGGWGRRSCSYGWAWETLAIRGSLGY